MELLKRLTETPGVSGREERVRELIRREAAELFDDIRTDAMGNLICRRKPRGGAKGGRRVLVACHIDEIGFYVRHIDDKGFLRLNPVGGFDTRNLHARRVLVQGSGGKDLVGLMNPTGRPVHVAKDEEKKKVYDANEFYVDLLLPPEQVNKLVRVGDPVTLCQTAEQVGQGITGKAMDNRVASYVALEAVRKLARAKSCPNEIVYVATVQEEVGCRGAGPAAYGIEPDVAVAVDVTLACDTPGISAEDHVCRFGGGAAIKIMDGNSISDRALVDEWIALAKTGKIKHQLEVLTRGGTDAGPVQRTRAGYRTIGLSVPCRYVHTVTETVHADDLKAAVNLLAAFLAKKG